LPEKFVIKCTHDSGVVIICNDKKKFDYESAKKKVNKDLKRKYFYIWREWPYKNVKPRIIIEKLLVDKDNDALTDYKFFCFNGEPKIMYISHDAGKNPTTDFFDMNFNHLDIKMKDPNSLKMPDKPEKFEEMIELSKKLSKGIPHLRVDFYLINGKIYFGELTFYHNAGFSHIYPDRWNKQLGDWIKLPK
jgi:hypothetical protein